MAAYQDPRKAKLPDPPRVRAGVSAKKEPRRAEPKPQPAQKPIFTDWAMI